MGVWGTDPDGNWGARGTPHACGWDTGALGGPPAARAIEPLAMLWCIPGILRNDWARAFRVLRP